MYEYYITVDINPSEVQYIPINSPRNITCHIEGGGIIEWYIVFSDGSEEVIGIAIMNVPSIPGITGTFVNEGFSTLVITVNTSNTSVTRLRCTGRDRSLALVTSAVNITIYGKLYIILFMSIK